MPVLRDTVRSMTGRLRGTLGRRRRNLGTASEFSTVVSIGEERHAEKYLCADNILFGTVGSDGVGPSGELVGGSELGAAAAAIQKSQIAPASGVAIGQRGFSGGKVILAQGDMSGRGPGLGGQKGQKKGGYKGKQAKGKDNPNKAKGKDKS